MNRVQPESPAATLLKLTGTLMLIFGILGSLLYAAFLAVFLAASYMTGSIFSGVTDVVGISLLLAAAVAELVSGALGMKAAKRSRRAGACLVWGAVTLVLTLAGIGCILLRLHNGAWWEAALAALLGVVTPAVYLYAAARRSSERQASAARMAQAAAAADPSADAPDAAR